MKVLPSRCEHGFRLTAKCPQCLEHQELAALSAANRSERGYARKDGKRGTENVENPKHFAGLKKVLMSVIPWPVIWELGVAMLEGALKYGAHNYRAAGQIRASTYFNGTMRHMTQWWEGEDMDPDTNNRVHHIVKAIASNVVLRDAMLRDNFVDDRPPRSDLELLQKLNDASLELMKRFPDPVAPYTQVDFSWVAPACAGGQAAALQRDAAMTASGDAA